MNVDSGSLFPWDYLTDEEKASGRWVKLSDGEFAKAQSIEDHERAERVAEIFRSLPAKQFSGSRDFTKD